MIRLSAPAVRLPALAVVHAHRPAPEITDRAELRIQEVARRPAPGATARSLRHSSHSAAVWAYRSDGVWAYREVGASWQYAACGAVIGVPRLRRWGDHCARRRRYPRSRGPRLPDLPAAVGPPGERLFLRLIAVLLVIGLLQTYRFLSQHHAHPVTFAALGGSLVLAAIFGGLRARTVRVWLGRRAGVVPGQLADRGLVDRLPGRAPRLRHHGRTRERHPGPGSRHHRSVPGHQLGLPAGLGDAACPQAAARRTCCSGRAGGHRLEDMRRGGGGGGDAGPPANVIPHISRVRSATAGRSRAKHYEHVPVRCSRIQSPP